MEAGAALFIFIGAVCVAGIWAETRKESERQETLRRLLDKGDKLAEQQLRDLVQSVDQRRHRHGESDFRVDGARGFRVAGTLVVFAGVAMMIVFGLLHLLRPDDDMLPVVVIGFGVAVFGTGFFVCSRLFTRQGPDASVLSADRPDGARR